MQLPAHTHPLVCPTRFRALDSKTTPRAWQLSRDPGLKRVARRAPARKNLQSRNCADSRSKHLAPRRRPRRRGLKESLKPSRAAAGKPAKRARRAAAPSSRTSPRRCRRLVPAPSWRYPWRNASFGRRGVAWRRARPPRPRLPPASARRTVSVAMPVPRAAHVPRGSERPGGIRDRKSTRLNSSHSGESRMPSSA